MVQSGGCAIHCQDCSISQLCIPFTLNDNDFDQLDSISSSARSRSRSAKSCSKAGDELKSLYAIRSGPSSHTPSPSRVTSGSPPSTSPGDLVGFDAIHKQAHPPSHRRWETAMVCEIPFDVLDDLSGKIPQAAPANRTP